MMMMIDLFIARQRRQHILTRDIANLSVCP